MPPLDCMILQVPHKDADPRNRPRVVHAGVNEAVARFDKETVRRWFAETVRGGIDVQVFLRTLDETFGPGFVDHDGPDPEHGREALRRALPGMLHTFPDLRFTVEHGLARVNGSREKVA